MSKAPFKTPASYEAAMEELEQLTGLIESGQLPLEQLLQGYERGAELLKFCRDKLQAVEEQIKVLDAGVLKPWAASEFPADAQAWSAERLQQVERACPPGSRTRRRATRRSDALRRARWRQAAAAAAGAGGLRGGGRPREAALRAACAVELIHAYSLVHDDMPCMDNDILRRGKPTVHVQFGEATALLAGDALQALAFELLAPQAPASRRRAGALCRLLAQAAGHAGMAGGQAIDLASVGRSLTEDELREMHSLKTGALLQASVTWARQRRSRCSAAARPPGDYGRALGLAFQVVDDILDVTADSATLGKTAGKDAAQDKPTYVSLLGLERAAHIRWNCWSRPGGAGNHRFARHARCWHWPRWSWTATD
jgi:farnesyl diphosphate synthase